MFIIPRRPQPGLGPRIKRAAGRIGTPRRHAPMEADHRLAQMEAARRQAAMGSLPQSLQAGPAGPLPQGETDMALIQNAMAARIAAMQNESMAMNRPSMHGLPEFGDGPKEHTFDPTFPGSGGLAGLIRGQLGQDQHHPLASMFRRGGPSRGFRYFRG